MFKTIRTSRVTKFIIYYLSIMMFLQITQPMQMYALTSGPTQPEFNAFTPISTSDMVDLTSGDFNYNIPIMDVGGYPLNLTYNSGITMDQEASWVGLGWNLNVGQIGRQVRGLPDDFKGDPMRYENDLKKNITVGSNFNFHPAFFGQDADQLLDLSLGLGVEYNNYEGVSFKPSFGISFGVSESVNVGMNFSSSVGEGATVNPSVSISGKHHIKECSYQETTGSFGVGYNSRKGLENFSVSVSNKTAERRYHFTDNSGKASKITNDGSTLYSGSSGGSLSLNNSLGFTPTKRVAYDSENFTFNANLGLEIFGVEGQGQITGYGSYQEINGAYKDRYIGAYGYENSHYKGGSEGVLDFNREKEQIVSKNTNALPVTNYTYDVYSIEGQGISGMFRPYRSQVASVYNDNVVDFSVGTSLGVEIGGANLVHGGVNVLVSPSISYTGNWVTNNSVLPLFSERNTDANEIIYEPVVFKLVGEMDVDRDQDYLNRMLGEKAVRVGLYKSRYNNHTLPIFEFRDNLSNGIYSTSPISRIKRTERYLRNQVVQKISDQQAVVDPMITRSTYAKPHHTAGMKILKTDGSTYVYGQPVYNIKKVEATFDVSSKSENAETNIASGVTSVGGYHSNNSDQFVNKITTPAYAHSYLLTSILSADYEDVDANGPTENDLGSYTKFEYANPLGSSVYKWRVPFKSDEVSFNEGLKSHSGDQKGNYLYGEKELKYIKRIVTKTHVAIFHLTPREDARGASQEIGPHSQNGATMFKLEKISLYSLAEAKVANLLDDDDSNDDYDVCTPIKEAHFEYSYSLCKETPSNFNTQDNGKLTLEKVYFTYRNSKMGKYTPYVFKYGELDPDASNFNLNAIGENQGINPKYHIKGFDVWGNYKPVAEGIDSSVNSPLTNAEFPFVEQDKVKADIYTAAWVLKSVTLPSGGTLTIKTESDDYKTVQNKKAMQMFKVVGAGGASPNPNTQLNQVNLYDGALHNKYIYVDLGTEDNGVTDNASFKSKYLSENEDEPLYFNFLLNMTNNDSQYDYVKGYVKIDGDVNIIPSGGHTYAIIPLELATMEGGTSGGDQVNPISKAGWGFGRMYMNKIVYSLGGESSNTSFTSIVQDLIGSIGAVSELWKGPNKALQDKGCASHFIPGKSWIRLENPNGRKLGGGLRVKSIELSDNWNVMSSHNDNTLYDQKYGQEYKYDLADGTSSGVATFEPNTSPENPFVKPFYPNDGNYADRIAAPKDQNYIELPFGESFFPGAKVTYSRVSVSNLKRENGDLKVTKHATGKVITTHYTTKDFPTIVRYTDINMSYDRQNPVTAFLNIRAVNHLVASQGFCIETNDMDGKVKKQEVFAEDNELNPISSVEYKYNVGLNGKLDNNLTTINSEGEIKTHEIGVEYDMINDFNENMAISQSMGFDVNVASMLFGIFPLIVPMPIPRYAYHENNLRTAVTTKVIHRTGVLKETIAYDLGSRVSTENLAWDASSGQILLTRTINEYDDQYYSLNYPAYWAYDGMGLASTNLGIEGILQLPNTCAVDATPYFCVNGLQTVEGLFHVGDELILNLAGGEPFKAWVAGFGNNGNPSHQGLLLMDKNGDYIDYCGTRREPYSFRVVRSGYRNLQQANMASITLMANPLENPEIEIDNNNVEHYYIKHDYAFDENSPSNPRIINASAVVYHDFWRPQNEGMEISSNDENTQYNQMNEDMPQLQLYPNLPGDSNPDSPNDIAFPSKAGINPYLWNIKGDWRARESFAYLTGRVNITESLRNKGFFKKFSSFYICDTISREWNRNTTGWTSASRITKYSPFGAEIENEDALHRFSSAQYGYNYTLPMAVASNSRYNQIGFEGFEETPNLNIKKHFDFRDSNQSLVLSTNHSHTGKKSVKVTPNNPVKLVRRLSPVIVPAQDRGCEPLECNQLIESIVLEDENQIPNTILSAICNDSLSNLAYDYYRDYRITSKCHLPILQGEPQTFGTQIVNGVEIITGGYEFLPTSNEDQMIVRIYGYHRVSCLNTGLPQCRPCYNIPITIGGFTVEMRNTDSLIMRRCNSDPECFFGMPGDPIYHCCTFVLGALVKCSTCPPFDSTCTEYTHF